jgi:hypothetical protein
MSYEIESVLAEDLRQSDAWIVNICEPVLGGVAGQRAIVQTGQRSLAGEPMPAARDMSFGTPGTSIRGLVLLRRAGHFE